MTSYILDVNILFSGVLSQNELYKSLFSSFKFYTPDFALTALNKYRELILRKTTLKKTTLKEFTLYLFSEIIVVPDYVISEDAYKKAKQLCIGIDLKDTVYVALSIEMNLILITRDRPLHDGLRKKGFNQIILFENFIRNNELLR